MMKLGKILCCALLVLSASGMAQVSANLHVPTRSRGHHKWPLGRLRMVLSLGSGHHETPEERQEPY